MQRSTRVTACLATLALLVAAAWAFEATSYSVGADNCATAPAKPEDRRPDKSRLVIVTYNVEWLFSAPTSYPSPWKTAAEADEHLSAVATAIKAMDPMPDILAFEEVQDCAMLARLAAKLPTPAYKYYLVPGTDSATGQNVGLLTRVDPSETLWRTSERYSYPIAGSKCGYTGAAGTSSVSKHLFTSFTIGKLKVAMAVAHFVAFPTDPSRCAQREAQASVLRAEAQKAYLDKGFELVVLGDLNDYSNSVPDVANDKPTSRALQILSLGLLDEQTGVNATASAELFQVASLVKQSERYSSMYDGNKYSQIDHLLVSGGLWKSVASAWFDHGAATKGASDHWPLAVNIKTL